MMELTVARPTTREITQVELVKWPIAPQTDIVERAMEDHVQELEPRGLDSLSPLQVLSPREIGEIGAPITVHGTPNTPEHTHQAVCVPVIPEEPQSTEGNSAEAVQILVLKPTLHLDGSRELPQCTESKQAIDNFATLTQVPVAGPSISSHLVKRVATLSLLVSEKNQWPNPHLSIGEKCNKLGNNECWKAIGPAEELFNLISKSIGDILDARVDELEDGDPVAGHILLFNLYMIGKSETTARPTLLFTCKRPKPRRRAIKFVKESGILKKHPKMFLAESATPPIGMGSGYIRLLAGEALTHSGARPHPLRTSPSMTLLPRATESSVARKATIPVNAIVGGTLGGIFVFITVLLVILFTRRRKILRSYHPDLQNGSLAIDNRQWVTNWLRQTDAKATAGTMTSTTLTPATEYRESNYTVPKIDGGLQGHQICDMEISEMSAMRSEHIGPAPNVGLVNGLYGVSVVTSSTKRRSTIGGVLHANGVFYGLTVNHIFDDWATPSQIWYTIDENDCDSEFAFDEDEEDDQEIAADDVAITSQGSISDDYSTGSVSRQISASSEGSRQSSQDVLPTNLKTHEVHELQPSQSVMSPGKWNNQWPLPIVHMHTMFDSMVLGAETLPSTPSQDILLHDILGNSTSLEFQLNGPVAGVKALASKGDLIGLDWALIEMKNNFVDAYRKIYSHSTKDKAPHFTSNFTVTHDTPSSLKQDVNVISVTGYSGTVSGNLSPGLTPMKLSPRSKFQYVWTVTFGQKLHQGDSGSWVFDSSNGDLYGHIVAGIPESGIAYIIPAFKTFEEIRRELGPFKFALEVFASELLNQTWKQKTTM